MQIIYHVCYSSFMRPKLLSLSFCLSRDPRHILLLARPAASVDSRIAAQNALFEELYQSDLKNTPERATAYGDYRYNDQLSDHSLAAIARRHTIDVTYLERLKAISDHRLSRAGHSSLTTCSFASSNSASPTTNSKSTRCLSTR